MTNISTIISTVASMMVNWKKKNMHKFLYFDMYVFDEYMINWFERIEINRLEIVQLIAIPRINA